MIPPPTTKVMKMPEAASVYLPRPSTERLKMPPHMMEVHKPHAAMNIHLIGIGFSTDCFTPLIVSSALTLKVELSGIKIPINKRIIARLDTKVNCVLVEILPESALELARPTNIIIQYEAAKIPPIAAEPFVKSVI